MATTNPFDLLGDDDNDDLSQLIAAQQQKLATAPPASALATAPKKTPATAQAAAQTTKQPAGKLVSKPAPTAQALREARNDFQHGGGRGGAGRGRGGPGRGRGGRGFGRESADGENTSGTNNGYSGSYRPQEDVDAGRPSERRGPSGPRGGFRGSHRGGYSNGDVAEGERPRRQFERHSGTGRGNELKRHGAGRGNWGLPEDGLLENQVPVKENEKEAEIEQQVGQEDAADANKETSVNEPKEKEPEDKEMTLEEYEKVLEEKRKTLLALKIEERKVGLDKELEAMQLLSSKKNDEDVFIQLGGSEKDKRKEAVEKEERARKAVSINEFLKLAEGDSYYRAGGRGRGRGRGRGYGGSSLNNVEAPSIEDVGQFPSLGGK